MISTTNYLFLLLCVTSPEDYHGVKKNIAFKKKKVFYEIIPDKFCPYIPPRRVIQGYEIKDM